MKEEDHYPALAEAGPASFTCDRTSRENENALPSSINASKNANANLNDTNSPLHLIEGKNNLQSNMKPWGASSVKPSESSSSSGMNENDLPLNIIIDNDSQSCIEFYKHEDSLPSSVNKNQNNLLSSLKASENDINTIRNTSKDQEKSFTVHDTTCNSKDGVFDKYFTCDLCNAKLIHKGSLVRHILKHLSEENIQCDLCKMDYKSRYSLKQHMKIHAKTAVSLTETARSTESTKPKRSTVCAETTHKTAHTGSVARQRAKRSFQCYICQTFLSSKRYLTRHMIGVHGKAKGDLVELLNKTAGKGCVTGHTHKDTVKCNICQISFKRSGIMKHMAGTHGIAAEYHTKQNEITVCMDEDINCRVDVCNLCSKSFDDRYLLLRHSFIHSETESIKCDICNERFIIREAKWHSKCGRREYLCHICGKLYEDEPHFKNHLSSHTNAKIHKCSSCQLCFKTHRDLRKHQLRHTASRSYHQCSVCQKRFKFKHYLTRHFSNIHLKLEEPFEFECSVCKRRFRKKDGLKQHMLTHKREKVQCPVCFKWLVSESNLRKHKFLHTGERPFECEICKKCFASELGLKNHKLSHGDARPHKCSECDKCFKTPSHLRYHRFQHTGERPFVCEICKRGFTNETHRKTHMRIHTGEKPFKCTECTAAYPTKAQLQQHNLKHSTEAIVKKITRPKKLKVI